MTYLRSLLPSVKPHPLHLTVVQSTDEPQRNTRKFTQETNEIDLNTQGFERRDHTRVADSQRDTFVLPQDKVKIFTRVN